MGAQGEKISGKSFMKHQYYDFIINNFHISFSVCSCFVHNFLLYYSYRFFLNEHFIFSEQAILPREVSKHFFRAEMFREVHTIQKG